MRTAQALVGSRRTPRPLRSDTQYVHYSRIKVYLPRRHGLYTMAREIVISSPSGRIARLTAPNTGTFAQSNEVVIRGSKRRLTSVPVSAVRKLRVCKGASLSDNLVHRLV